MQYVRMANFQREYPAEKLQSQSANRNFRFLSLKVAVDTQDFLFSKMEMRKK